MKRSGLKMLAACLTIVGLSLFTTQANAGWWWGGGWAYGGCGCDCGYGCGSYGCGGCWGGCGGYGGCGWHHHRGCGCGCGYDYGCGCGGWSTCGCGCDSCCGSWAPSVAGCGCDGAVVSPTVPPATAPMEAPAMPPVAPKTGAAPASPSNTAPVSPAPATPGTVAPAPPEGGIPSLTPPAHSTSIQSSSEESGVLTVYVPYEAKVTINGLLTKSTGSKRHFVSYGLRPGYTYKYVVNAEVVREGRVVTDSQTVTLTAGGQNAVAFGFNNPPSNAENVAANQ